MLPLSFSNVTVHRKYVKASKQNGKYCKWYSNSLCCKTLQLLVFRTTDKILQKQNHCDCELFLPVSVYALETLLSRQGSCMLYGHWFPQHVLCLVCVCFCFFFCFFFFVLFFLFLFFSSELHRRYGDLSPGYTIQLCYIYHERCIMIHRVAPTKTL